MQRFATILPAFFLLLSLGCEFQEDEFKQDSEYSFYITGLKESITYTFQSGNGRMAATPDEVNALTILVIDANGELAYENHYNRYYEKNEIPDTVFIPTLPAGDYVIHALTLDYYNYYYYDNTTYPEYDSTTVMKELIIDAGTLSEGPIYVGKTAFTLSEEKQHVEMKMANISSKVTLSAGSASNSWLEIIIGSKSSKYYDLSTGSFEPYDTENRLYMYLEEEVNERSFYILPQTLTGIAVSYSDYYAYNSTPKISFDPVIEMQTGDAITFSIDLDAIMKGSGSASFVWETISWNDLGTVSVP